MPELQTGIIYYKNIKYLGVNCKCNVQFLGTQIATDITSSAIMQKGK